MRLARPSEADEFRRILESYNQCFYQRDLEALRRMYAEERRMIYFDNHADCDTEELDAHLDAVGRFFREGKKTESGDVEPVAIENLTVYCSDAAAFATAVFRYQSAPRPGVRATFAFAAREGGWRILHIHFSFDPSESAQAAAG